MTDHRSDQRVNEELALLQDLGNSRRIASFKAVLARTKLKPRRLAPPLPLSRPVPQPVRRPSREHPDLPFVAAQPARAPSADLQAAPSAD